jgi:hypothetical protein
MQKIYKPMKGARYGIREAQVLGEIVEKFGKAFAPVQLVESARPKSSPLHKLFNWDVQKAAEQHWLKQARDHINHLAIVIVTPKGHITKTRAMHSVVISKERMYARMEDVFSTPELREQVVAKALAEANGWAERYSQYKSVAALRDIFAAIKRANGTLPKRKKQVA